MRLHQSDWLILNQADETTAEIDITGVIGGSFWFDEDDEESKNTREKMRAELKALAEIKATKIIVNIDSMGGDVSHGLSIHDLLAAHPANKEVRINGMTASIATVIAMAGNTRKMSDNALFLVHLASSLAYGNKNEIKRTIEDLDAVDGRIKNIYAKRGIKEEDVDDLLNANNGNGKWIDASEAKEYGFIDDIIEPFRAAAAYDKQIFNKLKYPELPNFTNMTENDVKTFGEKLDNILNKVTEFFAPKPPEDKGGSEMTLEAALDKIKNLEAESITLKANVEAANQIKAEAEAIKAEAETAKADFEAKKVEADKILNELKELKNTWKPDARNNGGGQVDSKTKVQEILNKIKE